MNGTKSYLIYDIEIVFEGGRTYRTEIIMQDIAKSLQECKGNQRISYGGEDVGVRGNEHIEGPSPSPETLAINRSSPIST